MLAEFPDISGRVFQSQRARPYNSILILSLLSATSVQNLFLTYNQREVIDDESVITTLFMGINLVTCNLQPENEAGGSAESAARSARLKCSLSLWNNSFGYCSLPAK